jgi:chemotaxis protein CheD
MDLRLKHNEVFLHPGEFYFGNNKKSIGTILGSCIAICIWHPQLHIGGMCHFVLPARKVPLETDQIGRYAGGCIQLFLAHTQSRETRLKDYVAKIFGGANTMTELMKNKGDSVGERNAQVAMQLLIEQGVDINVADVGESGYRRITFNLSNGDVWVKRHSRNLHIKEKPALVQGITI